MNGKRVLVTGASQGIGQDIALAFAQAGATVVLSSRKQADLNVVKETIEARGGTSVAIACDVTDVDQVTALQTAVFNKIGGIDVLVNNAGMAVSHKFLAHPDALWHKTLDVNLNGVYYVTKAFIGEMIQQKWGRVINIASTASKVGGKYIAAYAAAKHGVLGLTRSLAIELAPHITVNAICPGYVDTPMTNITVANIVERTGMTVEQAQTALTKESPQRRLIQPQEITALALFLARENSHGITGQAINIDGGSVMF